MGWVHWEFLASSSWRQRCERHSRRILPIFLFFTGLGIIDHIGLLIRYRSTRRLDLNQEVLPFISVPVE